MPQNDSAFRANNFDAVRLALALTVVYSHSFPLFSGSYSGEVVSWASAGAHSSGSLAVRALFVISGFLILHSYLRSRSLGHYLLRRVRRVYPGYLVAVGVCAFVVVPLFASSADGIFTPGQILRTFAENLALRGYFPSSDAFAQNPLPKAVNGSLWSIPFEFWCYLGLIGLGLSRMLRRRRLVIGAVVALMLVRLWLDATGRKPGGGVIGQIIGWPYLWFDILPYFLLGSLIYLFRERLPRSRWLLLGSLLLLLVPGWLPAPTGVRTALGTLVNAPALDYATFHLCFSRTLRVHGAARWGDFSNGTYLCAFPIQQVLATWMAAPSPGQGTFALYMGLSMAASLAAGVISWYAVERWFLPASRVGQHARLPAPRVADAATAGVPQKEHAVVGP